MKLAEVSIRRSIFAAMMILALMVFGFFSLPRIGVELFPSVEFPVVTATVVYPGADPETMETKVADPIEEALQALSGVKRMTSRNLEGVSQVILEFELEVSANQALQDVRDKIAAIERNLPQGIDPPVIQKFDTGAAPVVSVALASDIPPAELTRIAKNQVKQRLQQISGVGNVDLIGSREREVKILVDPARMTGFGLTVDDVAGAIRAQSIELPAGYIKSGSTELTLKTRGEVKSAAEIADIIIPGPPGAAAIRIRDVANVVDGMEDARSASFLNGTQALALVIRKQSGSNVVALAERVREEIEELRPDLERQGIRVAIPTDNSVFVEHAIGDVKNDLLLGAILTVLIILVFLHDVRATFIAALAIPTSVVATFAFMQYMGFSFNNVSMLALSLSIGILVDDAIVVIENIYRHLEMGKPRMRAALDATSEIGLAVIATTLSIVAVFVPVAYMKGIIGRFFFQFGLTVSAAVLLSMLVSFTLTPMLSSRIMRQQHSHAPGLFARLFDAMFRGVERVYARVLRWSLRWPWTTIALAVASLFASCALVSRVPAEFLPPEDQSQFAVNVELPTGTALEATVATSEAVAADLRQYLPGIRDTFTTIGGGSVGQVNRARITVTMTRPKERGFSQQDAMKWTRERLAGVEGAMITVDQLDPFGNDGGFRSQPIQFSVRGTDLNEVVAAADALKAELAATGKFVDLDTSYRGGKPEVALAVDRNKAADLGVPVAAVARTVRSLMAGDPVSDLKEGSEIYDVILYMSEDQRAQFESLNNIKVRAASGRLVDLSTLVRVERDAGPSEIERQNRLRQVIVLASLQDVTLGEAQTIVNEAAARVVPGHLQTSFMGDAEIMAESFEAMLLALGLAIILVYMILAAQFDSLIQPVTIMVSLPLSVVGAFGGIYLAGMSLNIFSFIGLIMLMGLVTKTAILLVDFANSERERGAVIIEALVRAGTIRLRPISMTSAATIFGMVPVALALGEGGETRAPMAVIVIGGMITSTVLTLVVVPVVYLLFDRMVTSRSMRWVSRKFFGVDPTQPAESLDNPAPDVAVETEPEPASDDFEIEREVVFPRLRRVSGPHKHQP